MKIDQATLAKRLKDARINCGVTQEAAAEALGLPRTAIVHIEAGNRSVSTLELAELAELYGRPIADFFSEAVASGEEDVLLAIHRVAPEFREAPKVNQEIQRYVAICREGVALERLLGLKPRLGPPAYTLPVPRTTMEAVRQGQTIAEEEGKRIGLGPSPIPDMSDLVCSQGIWASGARFPDEMSGMFLRHSTIGMVILVNYDHPRPRKRFSYAHEYAHALLDRNFSVAVTTERNRSDLSEVRANAFAAAFLMPAAGIHAFLVTRDKGAASRETVQVYDSTTEYKKQPVEAQGRSAPHSQTITYQVVAMLAHHFGVSYLAAAYRLRSLGYLNQQQLDNLLPQEGIAREFMDDFSEQKPSYRPDRDLRREVASLATEAFRRDEISRAKLVELAKTLDMDGKRLVEFAKAACE